MKIHFIYVILLLVLTITVFNICYKPTTTTTTTTTSRRDLFTAVDSLEASLCPLRGFKCSDSNCDCSTICSGYEKINVMPGENIILLDEKILPGTYCVPKGISSCNRLSSTPIFSTTGWMCQNKVWWQGNYMLACKSSKAKDNSLNVLMDSDGRPVVESDVSDYYEKLPDGTRKYQCHCGSLDQNGNRMLEILPFICSSDYCIEDIENASSNFGWKDGRCHCGPFAHQDESDPTSPCLSMKTKIEKNNILVGRVNCMTKKSTKEFSIYCPNSSLPYVTFTKRIGISENYTDYLTNHYENFETLVEEETVT